MFKKQQGFTLLEILLVVAAIAILAGIVIVAINPNKQLGDTRNTQRSSDVNALLNAVYQYSIDNNGNLPSGIAGQAKVFGDGSGVDCTATSTVASAALDLSGDLVPTYLVSIPHDPMSGSGADTDYYIYRDANGRVTVGACLPEQSEVISVTK
jgi:prepilin-type N-terminal cleavage/methylation domain-containing protein